MHQLPTTCELRDRDAAPASPDARIRSCERTCCADCVATRLRDPCPARGGDFAPGPIRPRTAFRPDRPLGLAHHPATATRIHARYPPEDFAAHVARIRDIPPAR